MYERVEEQKDEDGGGRVTVSSPHAEDGNGMVVRLQVANGFTLEDEDDRIDDFVLLGDVEEPNVDTRDGVRSVAMGDSAGKRLVKPATPPA